MRYAVRLLALTALLTMLAIPAFANWVAVEGYYTTEFLGVTYNENGTSTWSYGLVWDSRKPAGDDKNPALSHFGVEFCNSAIVTDYSPRVGGPIQSVQVGPDPSLGNMPNCSEGVGFYGIKWNTDGEALPYPATFQFTLDKHYAVGLVRTAAKAGLDCNVGMIYGPSLDCEIANPDIAVDKSCLTPAVFVGDKLNYAITVTNSGNVPLANVVVADPIAGVNKTYSSLAAGESHVINASIDATEVTEIVNTVTVSGEYFKNFVNATSSCTSTVYDISVSKTANPSFEREYFWSLSKVADPFEVHPRDEDTGLPVVDFCAGESLEFDYEVTATRTFVDRKFKVEGTIAISNPAPIAASLQSVVDVISAGGGEYPALVSCPSFVVPAGGTLLCTYTAAMDAAIDGMNTATAKLLNGHEQSGEAEVDFQGASPIIKGVVTLNDTIACPAGFRCEPSTFNFVFEDEGTRAYTTLLTRTDAFCDTFFTLINSAYLYEDPVVGASAGAILKTCACGHGCTLTIGYWKTHAGFNGKNADRVTQYLPISLGKLGPVDSAAMAVDVLSMKTYGEPSNGITKLYAQYLAAKLNIANGASFDEISKDLQKAETFLAMYDYTAWYTMKQSAKKDVINWMSTFDAFNNGLIGPGHCD